MNWKIDMKKAVALIVTVVVLSLTEIATARNTHTSSTGCSGNWYHAIINFATGEEPSQQC